MFSESSPDSEIRMFPSQMNLLIEAESTLRKGERITIPVGDPGILENYREFICYSIQLEGRNVYLFNVVKDSRDRMNQPDLNYIGELFPTLMNDERFKNATILIPMRQCRGFLHLSPALGRAQRKHIVLVEVNREAKIIILHDSQGKLKQMAYPDCMEKLAAKNNLVYRCQNYGVQNDDILCGYYVHQYMRAIMSNKKCDEIIFEWACVGDNKIFMLAGGQSKGEDSSHYFQNKNEYLLLYNINHAVLADTIKSAPTSGDAF